LAGAVKRAEVRRARSYVRPVLAVALATGIIWFLRPRSGPADGSSIGNLDLKWVAGAAGRLQRRDLLGGVVVIEAFAGWCSTCKRSAPELNRIAGESRNRTARFIGISLDSNEEEVRATASAWKLEFPVALGDERFRREFQINLLPTLLVVDARGVVRHCRAGPIDAATLEGWLTELGAGPQ
jgi:cytochrome c biogenesis protein CcmG/thiol:disulfide interchange protein DsbE